MKSYLKIILSIAGLSAVSTAVFTLTSCDSTNGKSLVEAQSTPANLYRKYLSEVRGQKELSFEDLTAYIGKWRTLKDSVTAAMHRDTAYRTHSDIREECILLHDSVRSELSRLAMAESVFALWKYGQSAYVPSVAQMRLLYAARGIINPVIEKCGGDPLPTEANECWYWTSTEVEGQQTVKAWLYSTASGAMQETPKTQAHKVRPIITINN